MTEKTTNQINTTSGDAREFLDSMNVLHPDDYVYSRAQLADAIESGRLKGPDLALATSGVAVAVHAELNARAA